MADNSAIRRQRRERRRKGLRKRIIGEPDKPRLAVYRSLKHIYAQVIDDRAGRTLAAADSRGLKLSTGGNTEGARAVGKAVAERARTAGVDRVAFDRAGFRYHGRIKALADAAREQGLDF